MARKIVTHNDLEVYRRAFEASMKIFDLSKLFPREEMYSMTDQMRRCSRSIATNLGEAWRRRRYEKAFVSKLNEVEGEIAETQVWLEYAVRCEYMARDEAANLYAEYNRVMATVVGMINHPEKWVIGRERKNGKK
jgi:four helix bundle protein